MDIDNMNIVFADNIPESIDPTGTLFKSLTEPARTNTRSIVLFIIAGLLSVFLAGNYVLYTYAQKSLPPRKKKPVSAKKTKREKLKNCVSPLGE